VQFTPFQGLIYIWSVKMHPAGAVKGEPAKAIVEIGLDGVGPVGPKI
jgi:hypothetical protein